MRHPPNPLKIKVLIEEHGEQDVEGFLLNVTDCTQLSAAVLRGQSPSLDLVPNSLCIDGVDGLLGKPLPLKPKAITTDALRIITNWCICGSYKVARPECSHAARPSLSDFAVLHAQ